MKFGEKSTFQYCAVLLGAVVILIIGQFSIASGLNQACRALKFLRSSLDLSMQSSKVDSPIFLPEESKIKPLVQRIQNLQPKLDPILQTKIAEKISENSEKFRLSPSLILHLICRETVPRFNPLSTSEINAIGLMQIRYKIHSKDIPELAKINSNELYHVDHNIRFGCQILRKYIDSTKSLDKALLRYVGGSPKTYVNDIYRLMAEWEQKKYEKVEKKS